jgi:hypothetical protein
MQIRLQNRVISQKHESVQRDDLDGFSDRSEQEPTITEPVGVISRLMIVIRTFKDELLLSAASAPYPGIFESSPR